MYPYLRIVDARSIGENVTQDLREAIITGELCPGQRLIFRQVADLRGVSPIPVREAFRTLAVEGLVASLPRQSAQVSALSIGEWTSVYRLLRILEPNLLARYGPLVERDVIGELEMLAAIIGDPAATNRQRYTAHKKFHLTLLEPAGDFSEKRIFLMLWQIAERYFHVGFGPDGPSQSDRRRSSQDHLNLLQACRGAQLHTIEQASVRHVGLHESQTLTRWML